MKISANTIVAFAQESGKFAGLRERVARHSAQAADSAGLPGAGASADSAANPAAVGAQLAPPPGLQQQMQRALDTPAEARNHGQSVAMDRVARNIAHYVEVQKMATPVAYPVDFAPEI